MANWDWGIGDPGPTPDPRRALPVFSVLPNWQGGITERLAWLTDVLTGEKAVEQRRSLRRHPRRSLEAGFLRQGTQRERLDMFFTGTGRGECLVPLWHDQYRLPEPTGDMSVPFPTGTLRYREFRLNDLVLVTAGNPDDFDVLTVTGVDLETDTLTLEARDVTRTWLPGTRIIPLRRARVMETPTLANRSDRVAITQVRFELSDADSNYPASWNYFVPLWRHRPDRAESVDFDHARTFFVVDAQVGPVEVVDPGGRAQVGTKIAAKFFGMEETYRFRQALHAARGRAVRFYMPTWTNDLEPKHGSVFGSWLDVKPMGITDYLPGPQDARRIICIVFKDGRPNVYRTIDTVGAITDLVRPFRTISERIFVTEPLPPIETHEIERIMFVAPVRFDQDGFELQHYTDGSKAVATSLVVRSTALAGMPPIDYKLTSKPYPLVDTGGIESGAEVTGGRIQGPTTEAIGSTARILGGNLS